GLLDRLAGVLGLGLAEEGQLLREQGSVGAEDLLSYVLDHGALLQEAVGARGDDGSEGEVAFADGLRELPQRADAAGLVAVGLRRLGLAVPWREARHLSHEGAFH